MPAPRVGIGVCGRDVGGYPRGSAHAMEEPVILVTGATGNTGSELVRLLAEAGAPARP